MRFWSQFKNRRGSHDTEKMVTRKSIMPIIRILFETRTLSSIEAKGLVTATCAGFEENTVTELFENHLWCSMAMILRKDLME
jgi:hypothetical protein